MNIIRKAVSALGGICLAALLIAALAPKAARSAAAAVLVQVTNTAALAVPSRDVGAANEPFFTNLCTSAGVSCGSISNFFTVPTNTVDGKTVTRLVVEHVSGFCLSNGSYILNADLQAFLSTTSENLINGQNFGFLVLPIGPVLSTGESGPGTFSTMQSFSQPSRFYAEPGDSPSIGLSLAANAGSYSCSANIEGYLVTQ